MHFKLHLEGLRPAHVSTGKSLRVFASEAGICDRRQHYRLMQTPQEAEEEDNPSAVSSVVFHIGNNLHDEFQVMMSYLHPGFTGEVKWHWPSDENVKVSGRCDGLYTDEFGQRVALEIKTTGKWAYNESLKAGIPAPKHALQAALSMYMLGATRVQVVYICKDWIDIHPLTNQQVEPISWWIYSVPPSLAIQELQHRKVLLENVQAGGSPPDRIARGEVIENPYKASECKFCPYQDICLMQGPPVAEPIKRLRKSVLAG